MPPTNTKNVTADSKQPKATKKVTNVVEPKTAKPISAEKKTPIKVVEPEEDPISESDNDYEEDGDNDVVNVKSESESDGEESESETDDKDKKPKEKKSKDSFDELTKKLETLRTDIKDVNKEISELEKQLKTKEKSRNEFERQVNGIVKILGKTHIDEVNKARKEKPKRKGNVNGGFNKESPVPELLVKFLGLTEGACMARPKVMSALNNKFSELGLKNGQLTTLDKPTSKALGLGKDGDGKVIKFTEFQSFLAGFYPKKEDKEIVV
jgi:predicted RNase H-like nuclease (RuvC/YqgF family)